MNNELQTSINLTFDELIDFFSSFEQTQLDVIPFEGSWTAGQVAEHIIKAMNDVTGFLNADIAAIDRPYDANVATIKNIFLDFTTKMQSPEFILPVETTHDKQAILGLLKSIKAQLLAAVETLDLSLACKSFEFPGIGFLTRFEWISFWLVHTQRHTHQLKNIYKTLNKI